ncbi:uncharacterized protein BXZ73DRAFT_105623 [Epithele typhae]|uniref:uncharacterized protein n=1 Tax=Epithele typhae TaxID=378194 RepID=UPI0020085914|nr:uncharacterized protein BXZ73DRAFT_105623 [Epithele typhae]KAH9917151.1 hypothetical protein BXZ73DRAFT_105623 [Epithele typhae]
MPTAHAPRKKACQALQADLHTPCSKTFRGWGRFCPPHLEEHARLSGAYKDAAARAERLRRHGELGEKQLRALLGAPAVDRALQKARQYAAALDEEAATRAAHAARFPTTSPGTGVPPTAMRRSGSTGSGVTLGGRAGSPTAMHVDEDKHEDRMREIREKKEACDALVVQLQKKREEVLSEAQQRRERYGGRDDDPERQPLLERRRAAARARTRQWVCIAFFVVLLVVVSMIIACLLITQLDTTPRAHV